MLGLKFAVAQGEAVQYRLSPHFSGTLWLARRQGKTGETQP